MQYTYVVGPKRSYKTVEAAIYAMIEDFSTISPNDILKNITISIEEGAYPSFVIPDNTTYKLYAANKRLIIKSDTPASVMPLIDSNSSASDRRVIGIDVGNNNPNISVCSLQVIGFDIGCRVSTNSNRVVVKNCLFQLNRYAGAWFDRNLYPSLLQNIFIDGNYGWVIRLCHCAAVAHNTVRLDGRQVKNPTEKLIGGLLQLHHPSGPDRGTAYVYGNLHSIEVPSTKVGHAIVYFRDDLYHTAVLSEYNLFHITQGKPILVMADQFYQGDLECAEYSLQDFGRAYEVDKFSKGDDPQFVTKTESNTLITLGLKATSPAIASIPRADTTTLYPTWTETNTLTTDFVWRPRAPRTAIGALEGTNVQSLFRAKFQDVEYSFTGQDAPWCTDAWTTDIFTTTINIAKPTVEPGYFYSHDREYYLYAQKGASYLSELTTVVFDLPDIPHATGYSLSYGGTHLDNNKYHVLYDRVYATFPADALAQRGGQILFSGKATKWVAGSGYSGYYGWSGASGQAIPMVVRKRINDCTIKYYLPLDCNASAPVVVTDDSVAADDPTGLAGQEFGLRFDSTYGRYELCFDRTNKFYNPKVYTDVTGVPWYWEGAGVSGVVATAPSGKEALAFVGEVSASFAPSGYLAQEVLLGNSGVFSFYAKAYSTGALGYVDFDFYAIDHEYLGRTSPRQFEATVNWTRQSYLFNSGEMPDYAKFVKPRVSCLTGNLLVDALQVEDGDRATEFNYKLLDTWATVEYELGKPDDKFVPSNFSVSPHLNYGDGFFCIPELSARQFDLYQPTGITTLFDWRWQHGRLNYLPWARIHGKDKLRCRPVDRYHSKPEPYKRVTRMDGYVAVPETVILNPAPLVGTQSDTNGQPFIIAAYDVFGNPCAFNYCAVSLYDIYGGFPGGLGRKFHGMSEQFSSYINTELTSYGMLSLFWVPPNQGDISRGCLIPTPVGMVGGTSYLSYIDVPYPINSTNAGNPVIINLGKRSSQSDFAFNIYGDETTEYARLVGQGRYSYSRTKYPIGRDKIRVYLEDGTELTRSYSPALDEYHFYVLENEYDIYFHKNLRNTIVSLVYTPRYVFINKDYPHKLMFIHEKVFGSNTGPILVGYDAKFFLDVLVWDQEMATAIRASFTLIARTPLASLTYEEPVKIG